MAKKQPQFSAKDFGKTTEPTVSEPAANSFYFGRENFKWMLIGLVLIFLGYALMTGASANTRPDGVEDPAYWNDGIFSLMRIRIAPLLVVAGFAVEVYAILKRKK